jgi:hypothetical protein
MHCADYVAKGPLLLSLARITSFPTLHLVSVMKENQVAPRQEPVYISAEEAAEV